MWFRNLALYRFSTPFTLNAEQLDDQLAAKATRPIGALEPSVMGWAPPLGRESNLLVHATGRYRMICARKEEKIMPAAAVNEVLAARVQEIEDKEGRKVRGKERANLKDEVIFDMLPRAFSKSSQSFAYIDPKGEWLIVDAGTPKKAEEITSLLRETLGSLPIAPLSVATAPSAVMTGWLTVGGVPPEFNIEDECELRDPGEDGGLVRVRKHDLGSDEIRVHLDAGKLVTRLALTFDDRINFVIDEQMLVKRIKFLEVVQDAASETDAETAAERFDGDFAVMSLEIARFLPRLIEAFGGEAEAETRNAA
ncbi:MAG: recombination-associated protein RdgC [Gammaproteobacteria bacterium]|nr:recombination-associated protein RdgC [Gammaproteobacteria bacterium]MCP5137651.1 recombination-associated protein RdgC [Gammaproteobacteria bacterium]